MYSMSLTIRKDGSKWLVEGETSEPSLAAGTRISACLELDVQRMFSVAVRDMEDSREYGTMLGQSVFVHDLRAAFHDLLSRVPHDDVLHVSLSVEDMELRMLRWERLCCPLHNRKDSQWEFLHIRQETAFSLDLRSSIDRRYPAISRVGLKALVVVADMGPTRTYKMAEFNASETVSGIQTALGKDITSHVLACSGASQIQGCDGLPTLDEICRCLTRDRYAVLHIVCHGEFKEWEETDSDGKLVKKSDTFLYLRKSGEIDATRKDSHVERVAGTEFLRRLSHCNALPHLTFLCSCSTASVEAEKGLGGLGQRLVRELAMPAVVAMTDPVPIDLATEISKEFYHHLRQTGEVDRALTKASAVQAARQAILVPTLFSRLAGRRLFDDVSDLTVAEWENGLSQLPALVQERAPILSTYLDKQLKIVQPALQIWKAAEHAEKEKHNHDERHAKLTLLACKAELNEFCSDFLENSFDHLAKDKPLALPSYDGRCPFPGLGAFDQVKTGDKVEDFRPFFFGRDALIQEICELLHKNRFLAVLGGSGSGKSSLIRAGVLEAIRRERPGLRSVVFPPGKDPLVRLQNELTTAPKLDILVVDQFEELFTLCTDLNCRNEFVRQLLQLTARMLIVITMRADFLGECARHDDLLQLLDAADSKHIKLIQPLKGNELRSVVEQQARAVGLTFEPGLAASIFDDLEGEPGAMPLLQHCLRQLWQHRHGRWLRLAEYAPDDRVGGVKGAISRTAEDIYLQLIKDTPEACILLPFIFERLARIDTNATDPEQRRDTRRREELSELTPAGGDAQVVRRIVNKLADAKLVVTTQQPQKNNVEIGGHAPNKWDRKTEVEVAHEALIRNWPRLKSWLDAARDTARLVERIRADAETYGNTPSSDNLTLRGAVLEEAIKLLNSPIKRLSKTDEFFLRCCQAEETRRMNERSRRRRVTGVFLIAFFLLCSGLALFSLRSSWIAQFAKEESRKRNIRIGIDARDRGELVAAAHRFVNAGFETTDRKQRDNLNMAALHLVENVSLQAILPHDRVTGVLPIEALRRVLSWGRDGKINLWEMEGKQIGKSMAHTLGAEILDVRVSDDLTTMMSAGSDDKICIWDLGTLNLIGSPLQHKSVNGANFIPDGRILSWGKDGVKIWDCETHIELQGPGSRLGGKLSNITFSPNSEKVLGWSENEIFGWDFKANAELLLNQSFTTTEDLIIDGAKFLNRDLLAVWSESNKLHVFSLKDSVTSTTLEHDGPIFDCEYIEEGKKLLTWSEDHKARLWDIPSGKPDRTFDCGLDDVSGAISYPNKKHVVTWSSKGAIRFWDVAGGPPVLLSHKGILGVKLIPEERVLSWSRDGSIALWDSHMPQSPSLLAKMHHADSVNKVVEEKGNIFTLSEAEGALRIWRMEPKRQIELRHPTVAGAESCEGQNVITWGGIDNQPGQKSNAGIRFWDIAKTMKEFTELQVESSIETCKTIDSHRILIGCRNGDVILCDAGIESWRQKLPNAVRDFKFSKDDSHFVVLTQSGDGFVFRWSNRLLTKIDLPSCHILDGAFRDKQSLLLCTDRGIFDVLLTDGVMLSAELKIEKRIRGGKVLADGKSVIYWNENGILNVWSSNQDKIVLEESTGFANVAISERNDFAIAFGRKNTHLVDLIELKSSPLNFHVDDISGGVLSDTRIVTWAGNEIQLSDLASLAPVALLTHEDRVLDVRFSADKSTILSSSADRTARMWDAESGDLLLIFNHDHDVKGARFLGNSFRFVTWQEGESITIWNPRASESIDLIGRTGTIFTDAGRINVLNSTEWRSKNPKK